MGEIKRKLKKLKEGKKYTATADQYLIQEHNTLADIIRFTIKCSSIDEVQYILDVEKRNKSN